MRFVELDISHLPTDSASLLRQFCVSISRTRGSSILRSHSSLLPAVMLSLSNSQHNVAVVFVCSCGDYPFV